MPQKRSHRRKTNKPPTAGAGALEDCVLPPDMMLCITTRLPVKSVHRFKSVCKPWRKLFSTPKFMKMHHDQLSQNQSVMVLSPQSGFNFSLFDTNEEKPTNLADLFPDVLSGMNFIGCCNGLICASFPPSLHKIGLWNPALKLSKPLRLPKLKLDRAAKVSLGLGYDEKGDDFKLVRIVVSVALNDDWIVGAEVYSANLDSWKIITVGFEFFVQSYKNDVIVNGTPYWVAFVDQKKVLVWFDMSKMVFDVVPLSSLKVRDVGDLSLVDWKGALAALACTKKDNKVLSLDVWVFDAVGKVWSKNFTFGPIGLKVERVLQCFQNGKIIGECLEDGKLFVFDSENGGVKEIVINEYEKRSFQVYGYTESLAYFKRMAKDKVMIKEKEEEEEEELEIDNDVAITFTILLNLVV